MRKLYAAHAYLNFTPVPNTDADDEAATISLKIDVDEGPQFHFVRLSLAGEEPQAGTAAKLMGAWIPNEGKLYDPQVLDQYWQSVRTLLPPELEQQNTLTKQYLSTTVFPQIDFPDPENKRR
jgi:outer membrane protein assembly factor BamA